MVQRVWWIEFEDRWHRVELEHAQWSGRRRIRLDGELVHESQVLFDLGATRHRFRAGAHPLAVTVRSNGATYRYSLVLDDPTAGSATELAPASALAGRGNEPAPASAVVGEMAPRERTVSTAVSPAAPVRILPAACGDLPAPPPHVGTLCDATFGVLSVALGAALIGAALGAPDAGALVSAAIAGTAGAAAGRRRGERLGGETLHGLLGGLMGAMAGLSLGAGVFGLLVCVLLALPLLAPLPQAGAE